MKSLFFYSSWAVQTTIIFFTPSVLGRAVLQVKTHLNLPGCVTECKGHSWKGKPVRKTGKDHLKQIEVTKTPDSGLLRPWYICLYCHQ